MKVFEFGLDEKDMKAISALNQNLRKIVPINKVKLDFTLTDFWLRCFIIMPSKSAFLLKI